MGFCQFFANVVFAKVAFAKISGYMVSSGFIDKPCHMQIVCNQAENSRVMTNPNPNNYIFFNRVGTIFFY